MHARTDEITTTTLTDFYLFISRTDIFDTNSCVLLKIKKLFTAQLYA